LTYVNTDSSKQVNIKVNPPANTIREYPLPATRPVPKYFEQSCYLLGSHTGSVRAESLMERSSRLSSVCLSRVRSQKLSEIGAKFRHLYRKSGSPSKNVTSDFEPEVDKNPKIAKMGSVRDYCFAQLAMQLIANLLVVNHAGGSRSVCGCLCLCVSMCVRALKEKRLELSTPNLICVYSMAVGRHALTQSSIGQR